MGMDVSAGPAKKGKHTPEMNVTPLVDVVLVLLIIFMVITPALSKQVWLHIPSEPDETQVTAEQADPEVPLVVSVNREGAIRINRDAIGDGEFPVRLTRILAARGDRKVFFDAHDAVHFERAAAVMDLARQGGARTIAVMTAAVDY